MEENNEKLERTGFPTGKREGIFVVLTLLWAMLLVNMVSFSGFYLGFAVAGCGSIAAVTWYLARKGNGSGYGYCLMALSFVLCASFLRSGDLSVKFVSVCFLLVSVNLGAAVLSGNFRYNTGLFQSILDAPRALFSLGCGKIPDSFYGLRTALRNSSAAAKRLGAVAVGLCIALPIVGVLAFLLMRADAAFEQLINLLPDTDLSELPATIVLGAVLAAVLYSRCVALKNTTPAPLPEKPRKGLNSLTLNTILGLICGLYFVYLFSQLGYFIGGFAGDLPQQYTLAEYARRGFFEMAWISGLNLCIICACLGISQTPGGSKPTRWMCGVIASVTLFFIATASAKMVFYIQGYGLTRLRVLTQVVMVFLALLTVLILVRLIRPNFRYMPAATIAALAICAAVSWTDVDTLVANYNVDAYLSGTLETIDMPHLESLGEGAVPAVYRLATQSTDRLVSSRAYMILEYNYTSYSRDPRSWNIASHIADGYLQRGEDSQVVDTP